MHDLSIKNLSIFCNNKKLVSNVTFTLKSGDSIAIVGESGSGKSLLALAINQCLQANLSVCSNSSIKLNEQELTNLTEKQMQSIRGNKISMIFQEAQSALNPVKTIGWQILEALKKNKKSINNKKIVHEILNDVGLKPANDIQSKYPHELSGGMQQRACIALALALEPKILIADEPTTALDASIQKNLIDLLKQLQKKRKMSLLFITHDLHLAHMLASSVIIMRKSKIIETGKDALITPTTNYTKSLLAAANLPKRLNQIKNQDSLLKVEKANLSTTPSFLSFKKSQQILSNTHINLYKNQTYALVGASGSGKTSLARAICGLTKLDDYQASWRDLTFTLGIYPQKIQMIFQNSLSALNPRQSIFDILSEGTFSKNSKSTIEYWIQAVGLSVDMLYRLPHQFSGGQRQRICIARALLNKPELLVLDEPTSALDVSVQADIIKLLKKIQKNHKITYLLITHDFNVAMRMAHFIGVMQNGKIIETGTMKEILNNPQHQHTKELLNNSIYYNPAMHVSRFDKQ